GEERILKTIVITPSGRRSAVVTTRLNNKLPLAPVSVTGLKAGLKSYLVPGEFTMTGEIDTLKAIEKNTVSKISLSGFRGKGRTHGAVFSGYINIPEDGVYTFTSASDDGSVIRIDDQLVLDNDAKHSAYQRTSAVRLMKGYHKFEVRYFQVGGSSQLQV